MPVHLLIIHFSLFNCSGVMKISQKIQVSILNFTQVLLKMLSHSSHLIQPVQSLFSSNSFNGVSFEWALTHRSFPRILPDSSNFSGVIPKFISKCDVRMDSISHMSFSKIFQILFIIGSTFPILIPECLNNSWWCF